MFQSSKETKILDLFITGLRKVRSKKFIMGISSTSNPILFNSPLKSINKLKLIIKPGPTKMSWKFSISLRLITLISLLYRTGCKARKNGASRSSKMY